MFARLFLRFGVTRHLQRLGTAHAWQDDDEFFTAQTASQIHPTGIALEAHREFTQHHVAYVVPEGWVGYGSASAATSQGGTQVTIDTTALPGNAYAMHGHTTPAGVFATHDLEWELTVQSADHNLADGSAVVFPDYNGWIGASGPNGPVEREQMIWFDDGEIGWGDFSQTATLSTHVPHVYRLHRTSTGTAKLFVDGVPTLSRATLITTSANVGFGDQTNDWTVNGRFDISYMRLVPQPQCQ